MKREITCVHAKTNLLEHGQSSQNKKNKKWSKMGPKGGILKKQMFVGKCFNGDKICIKSTDCKLLKKKKPNETNIFDGLSQDVSDISLSAVILDVNMAGSITRE